MNGSFLANFEQFVTKTSVLGAVREKLIVLNNYSFIWGYFRSIDVIDEKNFFDKLIFRTTHQIVRGTSTCRWEVQFSIWNRAHRCHNARPSPLRPDKSAPWSSHYQRTVQSEQRSAAPQRNSRETAAGCWTTLNEDLPFFMKKLITSKHGKRADIKMKNRIQQAKVNPYQFITTDKFSMLFTKSIRFNRFLLLFYEIH